jgi:hypothetical protein
MSRVEERVDEGRMSWELFCLHHGSGKKEKNVRPGKKGKIKISLHEREDGWEERKNKTKFKVGAEGGVTMYIQ